MPAAKTGFLAGGIAVLVALLVLRIASEILIPFNFLLDFIADSVIRQMLKLPDIFADFIFSSTNPFRTVVPFIVLGYIIIGGVLGVWANVGGPAQMQPRAIAGGAILFFISFGIVFTAGGHYANYHLIELLIGLAVSFLAFAITLRWLLAPGEQPVKWPLAGLLALISLGFIVGEVWLDNPL